MDFKRVALISLLSISLGAVLILTLISGQVSQADSWWESTATDVPDVLEDTGPIISSETITDIEESSNVYTNTTSQSDIADAVADIEESEINEAVSAYIGSGDAWEEITDPEVVEALKNSSISAAQWSAWASQATIISPTINSVTDAIKKYGATSDIVTNFVNSLPASIKPAVASILANNKLTNDQKILALTSAQNAASTANSSAGNSSNNSVGSIKLGALTIPNYLKWNNWDDFLADMPKILVPLGGALFIIMFIVGGYLYLTSAGNEEQAERGKNTMLYAALFGLPLLLLGLLASYYLVGFISK